MGPPHSRGLGRAGTGGGRGRDEPGEGAVREEPDAGHHGGQAAAGLQPVQARNGGKVFFRIFCKKLAFYFIGF